MRIIDQSPAAKKQVINFNTNSDINTLNDEKATFALSNQMILGTFDMSLKTIKPIKKVRYELDNKPNVDIQTYTGYNKENKDKLIEFASYLQKTRNQKLRPIT